MTARQVRLALASALLVLFPQPLAAAAAHRAVTPVAPAGDCAPAGDSSGANLAAVIAQTFRDEGLPLAAQLLAYPPTDFTGTYPSRVENATGYMLTTENLIDIQHLYAGDDPAVRGSAQVSPLNAASLAGLAPAIVGTAQFDPLRDEGQAYADALRKAGVDVFVRNYDGLIHGFLNMFPVSPAAALTGLYAQLAKRLS
ncbi:acetyl esterase/lipase [Kitasatospora sp. MAP12-15]|uniref:alpha/beta hydrolase fold domain-containing protein n=1 Tax=unclassified Kitasatospora TaxID=2633591 RepID=UPI0024745392|nr:alpha/beta hydrolase fold domain-containing protein [Kitasatospora sp. MAP12-44]MDH6115467.1 acetyl esterase/lipase [Kitasatospora sp. MAP12-44]